MTPTLRTKRFIIRPFKQPDLEAFVNYRNDPAVAKYQSWSTYSLEQAQSLLDNSNYHNFAEENTWYQLAIANNENDELLGDIALHFLPDNQIEIGFTIASDNQQRGIATEALQAVLKYLFTERKVHCVIAISDARNDAAHALLNRLGFRQEAHYQQNVFFKGAWGDEYLHALLSKEFANRIC